jgi:hypothetical protein
MGRVTHTLILRPLGAHGDRLPFATGAPIPIAGPTVTVGAIALQDRGQGAGPLQIVPLRACQRFLGHMTPQKAKGPTLGPG